MIKQLSLFPESEKEIAEKQIVKVARQPDSRGMFQKAVKEDEKKYQDSLKPLIDPKHFVEVSNTYDGTNYIVDENGQITDEANLKKKFEKEEAVKNNYSKEATPEQVGKLAERLERNAQMSGSKGPFTNGVDTWNAIIDVSKNDPTEMKEIKKSLFRTYNKSGTKFLSDKELKIIKRGKYTEYPEVNIAPSIVPAAPVVIKKPEVPVEEQIRRYSEAKLKAQQEQWDYEFGRHGLSNLMRPK